MEQNKRLGDLLIEAEAITREDLLRALEVQKDTGERLGSLLWRLDIVDAKLLSSMLGDLHGVEGIDLDGITPSDEALAMVPGELVVRFGCLPLWVKDGCLAIAMIDPRDQGVIAALQALTSLPLKRYIALQSSIFRGIKQCYGNVATPIDMKSLRRLISEMKGTITRIESLLDDSEP